MNIFTHLSIAIKLKHIIEANFHVKLNTISFMTGNIKPDLSSRYINIPHLKKESEGFVREEIQNLLKTKIYEYENCSRDFSEKLGIITHYLSDFFCYAHSEYFTGSMFEHYIYEMHLTIFNLKNLKLQTHFRHEKNSLIKNNVSSLCGHLDELHKRYLCECREEYLSADIPFALKACTSICFSVISACMARRESFSEAAEEAFS